jgi:hydrogenase maturation protease
MAEVLILAIGNPLRGDDGIAPRAALDLAARTDAERLEVVTCHQLTPELAERVAAAQRVIFVDASVALPPGAVQSAAIRADGHPCAAFSHHATPSLLLSYSQTLFGKCPEAFQVSIGGESFEYSEAFSTAVQSGYAELIHRIEDLSQAGPRGSPSKENASA